MRKFLFALGLLGLACLGRVAPASAQACGVNFVPQVGVNCSNVRNNTYSSVMLSLVPEGTTATDFFCISGSTTKTVSVRQIRIVGTGTLVTTPIVLLHRATLDTGTTATSTYVKAAAKLNSTNAAATASVVGYNSTSGNPTITDSSPTYIRTEELTVGASGTATGEQDRIIWDFGTSVDAYSQGLDIPANTTEQFCLNLNSASITAVFEGYIEWTEH